MQLMLPRLVVVVIVLHLHLASSFTFTSATSMFCRLSVTNATLGTSPAGILGTDTLLGLPLGVTQYLIQIDVGIPPKTQYVIFNSGSNLMWIECNPCKCYPQPNPIFNPANSASFAILPCSSTFCDDLQKPNYHQGQCQYPFELW